MKKSILNILMVMASLFFVNACSSQEKETIYINKSDVKSETISVNGMTCLGCEVTLEKSISKIEGIIKVKASVKNDNVVLEYDQTKTDREQIINAIQEAGYQAKE